MAPEISPQQAAEEQLAKLQEAMVIAVGRHGYAETTVNELVTLAKVSKSTFYRHFDDKQECFLSTFEAIVERVSEALASAFREPGDLRQRLVAALAVFMAFAVSEPAAISLVVIDSLTLGAAGFKRRELASRRFELLLEQAIAGSPEGAEVSSLTARAVVGGVRGVAYRHLRAGTQAELPSLVEPLVEWATSYAAPDGEITRRAVAAAAEPAPPPAPADDSVPGWDEPPDSARSRRVLTQRERLFRAAAQLALARGFDSLSIPAISSAAGVSNQTFYECFDNKQEAFLAAFDLLAADVFGATVAAVEGAGDRPEALGVGIRALLEHIAANELFGRLAFLELPAAGPAALDRGDALLEALTAYLRPGTASSAITRALSPTALEAIGSGLWAVLLFEIYHGRREQLPELAPELTRLAVAPLDQP